MTYFLLKLLSGGTFTTGISLDWKTQFSDAAAFTPVDTIAGAVMFPGVQTTYGVWAAFAFKTQNPFDCALIVAEASVGNPVQVYVNDVLVSEVTAPGSVTISLLGSEVANKIEFVRACSPLVVIPSGALIDPTMKTGQWVSLFGANSDPFGGLDKPDSSTSIGP